MEQTVVCPHLVRCRSDLLPVVSQRPQPPKLLRMSLFEIPQLSGQWNSLTVNPLHPTDKEGQELPFPAGRQMLQPCVIEVSVPQGEVLFIDKVGQPFRYTDTVGVPCLQSYHLKGSNLNIALLEVSF